MEEFSRKPEFRRASGNVLQLVGIVENPAPQGELDKRALHSGAGSVYDLDPERVRFVADTFEGLAEGSSD